jgi:hypothetical protein
MSGKIGPFDNELAPWQHQSNDVTICKAEPDYAYVLIRVQDPENLGLDFDSVNSWLAGYGDIGHLIGVYKDLAIDQNREYPGNNFCDQVAYLNLSGEAYETYDLPYNWDEGDSE